MYEIDQYEKKLHRGSPTTLADKTYTVADNIARASFMVWGEHCVECSAPACYETCDLYESRPDTRCRRFQFGIYKNRNFPSARGYAAEVAFKKWGVLGAMGNTSMEPLARLRWEERILGVAARIMNAVGPVVARISGRSRWNYPTFGALRRLSTWLHKRNQGRTKPDAFVLEVYNPGDETVRMHLAMDYAPEGRQQIAKLVQVRPRFRTAVAFPKGYSRYEFDRRLFQSFTETGLPFNISLTPEADTSATLVFITADFVTFRNKKAAGKAAPDIKCVVWDLDNTIWDGILLENEAVPLKKNIKEVIETLDQRGILLSIVSKNDYESAWQRLKDLGIAEYFLAPQINWNPKSQNIRAIAKTLNIGLDTFAFVDDNPFELNEVGAAIPEVTCIDAQNLKELLEGARFQGSNTADAKNRRKYYQEAVIREEKQAEFGEDYLRFLEYCEICLEITPYREQDFDRVAELIQRTNQLNFSGRKYSREELGEVFADPGIDKYILHCSDKFGSYGLIGFGMARRAVHQIEIQDLMLSCRVQGKMIEQAFFAHLQTHHNPDCAERLWVNFRETNRNQPARQALEAARFVKLDSGGFARNFNSADAADYRVIQIKCVAGCEAAEPAKHDMGDVEIMSGGRRSQ